MKLYLAVITLLLYFGLIVAERECPLICPANYAPVCGEANVRGKKKCAANFQILVPWIVVLVATKSIGVLQAVTIFHRNVRSSCETTNLINKRNYTTIFLIAV
ncbi:uncharacterized protein LOC133838453 [Drosophila sulfurigaster albostrigata]|uniref:uncharacterized protein LOC133838453 n=1 Tax=Drosophila sulfurigaster albostrigata TaxID=89887 RepID=UPI002D21C4EB|nr:uncharacterized protein LOC133838453 [Drosophila sulfurigaster albostrigata]